MTRQQLNQLKIDAYRNFIKMQYGQDALDRLNYAIKKEVTDKIMMVRSKDFDQKLDDISSQINPD